MMRSVITLFALLALAGCATAPMAPPEKDVEAKKFETNPDMAGLYIYRNESFGGAISMDIAVNGKTIGNTAPNPLPSNWINCCNGFPAFADHFS